MDLLQQALNNHQTFSDDQAHMHFDKIVNLVEHEKIPEATHLIEKALLKGALDIRLISYYCYALFFQTGIKSFKESFPRLTLLVKEHWEDLKPQNRKDKQIQNSLNWLLSNLISKLKYCEKQAKDGISDPIWIASTEGIAQNDIQLIKQALYQFHDLVLEKWPKSPTVERVMHLVQKVEEIRHIIPEIEPEIEPEVIQDAQIEPEPSLAENATVQEKEDVVLEESVQEASPEPRENKTAETKIAKESGPSFENLHLLIDKLQAFDTLIKKNDFVKAAIVAKDIDQLIEHFDPTLYFPKLFSSYFALVARNIAALSEQWENRESLQSKSLEKLYKTDINTFLEW